MESGSTFEQIRERRIRHEERRRLLAYLVRGRCDAKAIGQRVMFLAYLSSDPDTRESQTKLAERLGVTKAYVSIALNDIRKALESGQA